MLVILSNANTSTIIINIIVNLPFRKGTPPLTAPWRHERPDRLVGTSNTYLLLLLLLIYVYVCMYVCMYACMCVYIYIYIYTQIHKLTNN